MTERNFGGERSPRDLSDHLKWQNVSGEEIPAYGVVKVISYNSTTKYFEVTKPDGEGNLHYVNGEIPVPIGGYGKSDLWNRPRLGLVNTGLALDDVCGPVANQWYMGSSGSGWVLFTDPISGIAALLKEGTSVARTVASGLYHALVCRCVGGGWYIVELKDDLGLTPPDGDAMCEGGSGGPEAGCDLCNIQTNFYLNCSDPGEFDPQRPRKVVDGAATPSIALTGSGIYRYAYYKRATPLIEGGQCTVRLLPEAIATPSSNSGLSSDALEIYEIMVGEEKMIKSPWEEWDCCDQGFAQKIACGTLITPGVFCPGPETPCPSV